MKYNNTGNTATLFSEQVNSVTELFEQWNDCERVVAIYAVLKRIPFSCIKFIQSVIETNLTQAYCLEQTQILENNANSESFLTNLSETYKNFKCNDVQLNKDSIFYESDRSIDNTDKYYDKKEDILNEILTYMPILTPGNDEAKSAYLEFIPMAVEDAIRGYVNTSLVQQIFSFLLIHPAFSTDDRRSLSKFLRHLENHLTSKESNFIIYPNGSSPTNESAHSTTSSSWQAVAPPQSKSTETISWDSSHHLTQAFADETNEYCKTVGQIVDFKPAPGASSKLEHLYDESGTDDHHISFSKNGTEILDFDCDDSDKSNTQIGFDTLANLNEFLTVPGLMENITLKTRRSNSLTTTGSLQSACTSSAHNLSNIVQKPRSFSLSMVSPRSSLTSSGSDTRLDDFKPNYTKFSSHTVGMSNIGQWLKSLRLHKYVWLFSNITYEQMLDITEEYLQNLNVTKGARHKLVICIQKLKERHALLGQIEKDLMAGKIPINTVLDELTNIVLTPMKPVEHFNKQDVGGQLLKVLNLVSTMMTSKHIVPQDEELINSLLWILEKAVHNEAFVAHTNQLKEHRFKVSRIKVQFPPKGHYGKSNSSSTSNITRSRSLTQNLKTLEQIKNNNVHNLHKRNSTYASPTDPSSILKRNERIDLIDKSCTNVDLIQKPKQLDKAISKPTDRPVPILTPQQADNLNTSFSKNGTLVDFNMHDDIDKFNTKIEFGSLSDIFLAKPGFLDNINFIPRRSSHSSLVGQAPGVNQTYIDGRTPGVNQNCRSNSLTNEHSSSIIKKQSESLIKKNIPPNYAQVTASKIGMDHISVWLKTLRLHKYTWLFDEISYDQMLDISDEYLEKLNITKGARHKLVVCINKLKERFRLLSDIQKTLKTGDTTINNALDELMNIVVTPFKPIQTHDKEDVCRQFLKVLNMVFTMLCSSAKPNEEHIKKFIWILDKAASNAAFVGHTNQLKQMKIRFFIEKP